MRILLVEDDREVADYVCRGLEEENNAVTVSFDGASALQAARSASFDCIVLDVMLPLMNGFEVTRRLRAQSITTPVLLLTARDTPQDVVQGPGGHISGSGVFRRGGRETPSQKGSFVQQAFH
jgi:DNA-binding response OmpR family regulator